MVNEYSLYNIDQKIQITELLDRVVDDFNVAFYVQLIGMYLHFVPIAKCVQAFGRAFLKFLIDMMHILSLNMYAC